jgi:hypothetical protein
MIISNLAKSTDKVQAMLPKRQKGKYVS